MSGLGGTARRPAESGTMRTLCMANCTGDGSPGCEMAEQSTPKTRPPAAEELTGELIARAVWFIRLRWVAVVMVLAGTAIGALLEYPVPVVPLLLTAAAIALYNTFLLLDWRRLAGAGRVSPAFFRIFCTAQILLDYLALTVTIHFTGGIESPATFFFVFHIIVAAMLLPGRSAYLDAVLATLLVGSVGLLEGIGVLTHLPVLFHDKAVFYNDLRIAGAWYLFLVLTFLISSFIASTIGASLERKIHALSQLKSNLEAANERLKAADREKTDFMNLVTHELRSPMVAIRSLLQTLAEEYAGQLNPEQRMLLERADKRAEQMIDMINDLLRLAKTRAGAVREPVVFDLVEETRGVVELFSPQAERAELRLRFDPQTEPVPVRGDRGDLRYVITNLVSNAIKYTPEGGTVRVEVRRENETALLAVHDTGIGIPPEDRPKLFTEFFRASNARRRRAVGTGLGLAISKRIVEAHGGSIEVQSTIGKGSSFYVRLPCGE